MYNMTETRSEKRHVRGKSSYSKTQDIIVTSTREMMSKVKVNNLKKALMSIDDFYMICEDMINKLEPDVILPYMLARYGVVGRQLTHMRNLKYGDINREEETISIYHDRDNVNGDVVILPIDYRFINWLDTNVRDWDTKEKEAKYVLGTETSNSPLPESNVRCKIMKFCKCADIESASVNMLIDTRQLELLLQIRKTRRLSSRDFGESINKYRFGDSSQTGKDKLVKRYEKLTGDEVIRDKYYREMHRELHEATLVDPNAYETATRLIKELDLKI